MHRTVPGLFVIALLAPTVLFSQDSPTDLIQPVTAESNAKIVAESNAKITDAATLNLHRWGAVTLFHGLPSDRVNAIAEDANGALWFGTDSGLVRYDGRRSELFGGEGAERAGSALLPSPRVRTLRRDGAGGLWVGTDAGAARVFNRKIEVITETRGQAVTGIAEAADGEIALVTEQGAFFRARPAGTDITRAQGRYDGALAVTRLDRTNAPLLGYVNAAGEARAVELTSVEYVKNGEWQIGSRSRGALIVRGNDVREAAVRSPRPYLVSAVYAARDRVWFGAQAGHGEGGLWFSLNDTPSQLKRFPAVTGSVTAIHGSGEDVWVGTASNGVFLLRGGSVVEHVTFENTAGGLRSNRINTVFLDHEGVVWFGTDRGVSRYDRDSFRAMRVGASANGNFVRSLLTTANGDVWTGTNRGLFLLAAHAAERGETGPWVQIPEIADRAVYVLAESGGTIWVGTESGLFARGPLEAQFHKLRYPGGPPSVRELMLLDGRLYARIYQGGVVKVEGDTLIPVSVESSNAAAAALVEGRTLLGAVLGAAFQRRDAELQKIGAQLPAPVQALLVSGERVWLGTGQGLFKWERGELTAVLSGADVQALMEGHDGTYCATKNAGLYKLTADGSTSIRFDTEQGLPSQQVFVLAEDKKSGTVWVGTNRGLVRYEPSRVAPRLEARRLVADQVYDGDYLKAELRFPSTQTSFLLEVAALGSRTFPSQFQYEYAFAEERRGLLKTLRTADSQFVLEGLKPGQYTITVRALSRDLVPSEPLAVRLWIADPPLPWTSIFLAVLLAVATVAGAWAYHSRRRTARANLELERTNAELREMRLRLAHETEAERSRIARDLHDQTLGDLRHLLVLIDQLPAPVDGDDVARPTSALLRKNIEEISREIRQICEDLSPSALENVGFVPALEWALTNAVAQLPAAEKFAYRFVCEPDLEERLYLTPTERIQLYRIVQEALNNVCRHARAKNVTLTVSLERGRDLLIAVEDDGVGLLDTCRSNRAAENGAGHGMANIRSRANLIGAYVAWLSADSGCRFEVRTPGAAK